MGSLSDVCRRLWALDRNRLREGRDYNINLHACEQGTTLFSFVDMRKLGPIYNAFIQLLNNYESETSVREWVTAGKINRNKAFLNRCLESKVMQEAHSYLSSKGLVPQRKRDFKEILYDLWFELHPRPSRDGTERSAFEHIFVGETKNGQVLGFHNWVRFYLEECQGNIEYEFFYPQSCDDRIITINFTWKNNIKEVGSFFLGTSPEFELAIYTVCFLAGNENVTAVPVILGNEMATILTHAYSVNGQFQIGACYPILRDSYQLENSLAVDLDMGQTKTTERQEVQIPIDPHPELTSIVIEEVDLPRQKQTRKDNSWCNCTIL